MAALSDLLTHLNVAHLAVSLPVHQLAEIPLPALVEVQADQTAQFAPVRKVSTDGVEWFHTERGWQHEPIEKFKNRWTGVALLTEPDETAGDSDYIRNRQRELLLDVRYPLIGFGIVCCLAVFVAFEWSKPSATWLGLWLIKLLGIGVCGLLVSYSLDATNPLLKKLCMLGKQTSCRSILQSDAAKLFSWLSWSDMGLLYFAGGFVALSVAMLTNNTVAVSWLVGLNLLALPYTLWSVYYQVVVARQFCTLCLTVQVLLCAEFGAGRLVGTSFIGTPDGLWVLAVAFTGVTVVWAFIRPLLNKSVLVAPLERTLRKVKFNDMFLRQALAEQPKMPEYLPDMKVLMLGNSAAENTLTIVTNPLCAACQDVHRQVELILADRVNLQCDIVLATSLNPNDRAGMVSRHILGLPADRVAMALKRWFDQPSQSVTRWSHQIEGATQPDEAARQLALHIHWCEKAKITRTPVLYMNGIQLPEAYSVADVPQLCRLWPRECEVTRQMDLAESR